MDNNEMNGNQYDQNTSGGYTDPNGNYNQYNQNVSGGYTDPNGNYNQYNQNASGGYYDPNGNYNQYNQNASGSYYDPNGNYNQYGAQGDYYQSYRENIYAQPGESNTAQGKAIASLVCGIASVLLCCCFGIFSVILGIIAVVLGILSGRDNGGSIPGMAIAGIACGSTGALMGIVYVISMFISAAGESIIY